MTLMVEGVGAWFPGIRGVCTAGVGFCEDLHRTGAELHEPNHPSGKFN
jgi:hypothetical protein